MRAAIIGDSHFDQHKRFEETKRLHAWIRRDAEQRGVTLTLHTGDLFERKSTPLERAAAFGWLQDMADLGEVVLVRGNHDAVDDLPLAAQLDSRHLITVVESVAVVEVGCALIACLAWPRKSALLAATGAEGREDAEAIATEALRDQLRGLGVELREHEGPTALIAHAMVRDSRTSTGQPLVGCDFEIGLDDLALVGADAYFLGHIHLHQSWQIGEAPVIYSGDPRRTDFGEQEAKGYIVAEWNDAGELVSWDFVEVPATRMVDLDLRWDEPGILVWKHDGHQVHENETAPLVHDAEVRVRWDVQSDQRQAAKAAVRELEQLLIAQGARFVRATDERVKLEQRARAEAIPTQAPLEEKVQAYWRAKGFDPGERRVALLDKLRRVQEVRRAA